MNITTELERRLLGAIGGFMGLTSHVPGLAKSVFTASAVSEEEVNAAIKADAGDQFNCTMWNLCNEAIGKPMVTHQEIMAARRGGDS